MTSIEAFVVQHGYWVVGAVVGFESMGVPMPGETALLAAAAYAGATHRLEIFLVILAAAIGAVVGDNLGFILGRRFGRPWLLRHGHLLRINARRMKVAQLLFHRHGGKVVFLGRFVALLRALAALLAGVNRMPWSRFLVFNVGGALAWAGGYGLLAYALGTQVERFAKPVGLVMLAVAVLGGLLFARFVHRHEAELAAEAERTIRD